MRSCLAPRASSHARALSLSLARGLAISTTRRSLGTPPPRRHATTAPQFEHALRAVDPTTCSHYWDYTVDALANESYAQVRVLTHPSSSRCWSAGGGGGHISACRGAHCASPCSWCDRPLTAPSLQWSADDTALCTAVLSSRTAQSVIFSDDWFGSADPADDRHVLSTGRWAYTPVMRDPSGLFSNITNPHGLLRSPWNTNPAPYLMRSANVLGVATADYSLPDCEVGMRADGAAHRGSIASRNRYESSPHAACRLVACKSCEQDFRAKIDVPASESVQLSDIVSALNGALHGPVHIMLGGHWGFNQSVVDRVHALMDEVGKDPFSDQILLAAKVSHKWCIAISSSLNHHEELLAAKVKQAASDEVSFM